MEKLKAELKRLEDIKVIIDNDLLELESLKKYLSKKVYKSNLEYTKAMQEKNNLDLAIINAKIDNYIKINVNEINNYNNIFNGL